MISLLEIAQSVKERASTDTYNKKSIGREDGETWDHAKGFAAKHNGEIRYFDINDYPEDMSNDEANAAAEKDAKVYAKTGKVANPKDAKKGDGDSEKDAGGKLGGSDFERDGGDDPIGDKGDVGVGELPDRSSELPKKTAKQQSDFEKKRDAMFKKARGGAEDDVKADLRKNPEKLDDMSAEELEDVFPSHEEYMEFETLRNQKVLKDRHPKLHKLASQSIQAKQKLESLEKELKDKLESGEFADPFVKGKEDPEGKKKFEDHQQKIKDAEEKMEDASNEVYYYQEDNADALDGDNIPYDVEDLVKGEGSKKDESIKVINGKQYKAIKEGKKSKKHILKENYDRFLGDKK